MRLVLSISTVSALFSLIILSSTLQFCVSCVLSAPHICYTGLAHLGGSVYVPLNKNYLVRLGLFRTGFHISTFCPTSLFLWLSYNLSFGYSTVHSPSFPLLQR